MKIIIFVAFLATAYAAIPRIPRPDYNRLLENIAEIKDNITKVSHAQEKKLKEFKNPQSYSLPTDSRVEDLKDKLETYVDPSRCRYIFQQQQLELRNHVHAKFYANVKDLLFNHDLTLKGTAEGCDKLVNKIRDCIDSKSYEDRCDYNKLLDETEKAKKIVNNLGNIVAALYEYVVLTIPYDIRSLVDQWILKPTNECIATLH